MKGLFQCPPRAKSFCPFRAYCLSHLPWAKGSSERPKRETTRLQKQLRMIKKRKLLIFEKHQRKETFLSEIAPFRCRIPYQCDT